ncbi:tetratricopeptide repeat protein [Saccharopolyspora spinosa]|uniref:ATP-binding protein n=1 Tax=Saccharopolyspora spinosa TaxID=60894 RepID=UPI0004984B52
MNGPVVQAGYVGHISLTSAFERPLVPRQLPLAIPGFTGRTEHLATLDALLTDNDATVISAVVGTAGVGKTALVVRWAHQAQRCFPDGTLYVNLRGYGPGTPATAGDVLADFLGALGISPERIPVRLDARATLYRSVLAGRRVLIVLDNADNVAQVRPLLPGAPGSRVVVTSRAELKGLEVGEGARRIPLDLFTEHEALELVRAMLGPRRAEAEPEAIVALVRACARLPLALRMAAGRAATHPHLTITELVAELDSERGRWEALSVPADEHSAVRTVFDWSYHRLPSTQARMFRRLGLHPGPEIGLHAAAAVSDLGVRAARESLASLAEQHLIEPIGRDRYTFHDLLRAYAADLAERDDDRDQARHRLLEWYAHHVGSAYRTIIPERADLHAGAGLATRARPEITFAGPLEAWVWADLESVNLAATVRAAAHHGLSEITMLLADIYASALGLAGRWDDALEVCRLGLTAARHVGDHRGECSLLQNLGLLYRGVNRWWEATDIYRSALALARDLNDALLEAEVLSHLGWGYLELEQYTEARRHLEAALVLSADEPPGRLHGFIEFCLSGVRTGLGDHERALRHAERSLALLRQAGISDVEASAIHAMARARQVAGAHPEAIALCERALEVESGHDNPRNHATVLDTLGSSLRHTGDVARAVACWREALAIFDERGDHRASDLRERLRALEADQRQQ